MRTMQLSSPLLTILIVSNNRRRLLEEQVKSITRLLANKNDADVELLISETNSEERQPSHCITSTASNEDLLIRYIFDPNPFVTAEEHLLARLDLALGEYCWILGDDDPIVDTGYYNLLDILHLGKHDYILYDSYGLDSNGETYVNEPRYGFPAGTTELSMSRIISMYGFWFVPSAFSTTIFRKSLFLRKTYEKHIAVSPIYSHVTAFIESFAAARCCINGEPLVWYRKNKSDEGDDDNWERLSLTSKRSVNFPWTFGFSSLLAMLTDESFISFELIRFTVDQNHDRRFVWHMLAIELTIIQCMRDIDLLASGNALTNTLYHDSLTHRISSWQDFSCFWSHVLGPGTIENSFRLFLSAYESCVLTLLAIERLQASSGSVNALKNRSQRLAEGMKIAKTAIYDEYLSPYMYDPNVFITRIGTGRRADLRL